MDYIWLIPILPGLGAALNGLVGIRFFGKRTLMLVEMPAFLINHIKPAMPLRRSLRACACAVLFGCSPRAPPPAKVALPPACGAGE